MKENSIVIFFPSFEIGGVERVLIEIANYFYSKDFRVVVIVSSLKGKLRPYLTSGIEVISLNCKLRYTVFKLRKLILQLGITNIITGPDTPNFISLLISFFLPSKYKFYITQHNLYNIEIKSLGLIGKLTPLLYKYLYPHAKKIIVVSEATKDMLLKYGISDNKIVKINNPINHTAIKKLASEEIVENIPNNYILFVGRLTPVKNIHYLLRSFKDLQDSNYNLNLIIVGDGGERKRLEIISQELGISNKVRFLGSQSNPYKYISKAKLVILSSYNESFGCVLIESMALGINVVTTKTYGGLECTENGKYGYICESFENEKVMADVIKHALSNPIKPDKLYQHSLNFSLEKIGRKYIEVLNQ